MHYLAWKFKLCTESFYWHKPLVLRKKIIHFLMSLSSLYKNYFGNQRLKYIGIPWQWTIHITKLVLPTSGKGNWVIGSTKSNTVMSRPYCSTSAEICDDSDDGMSALHLPFNCLCTWSHDCLSCFCFYFCPASFKIARNYLFWKILPVR